MMRSTPLYAPDGMSSGGRYPEHFDDGLVHNHHWAVTADEAYPSHNQGPAVDHHVRHTFARADAFLSHARPAQTQDRHDDGLVHNHEWAVTGK